MSKLGEKEVSSRRQTVPSARLTDAANANPSQVLPSQRAAVQRAQAERTEKDRLLAEQLVNNGIEGLLPVSISIKF